MVEYSIVYENRSRWNRWNRWRREGEGGWGGASLANQNPARWWGIKRRQHHMNNYMKPFMFPCIHWVLKCGELRWWHRDCDYPVIWQIGSTSGNSQGKVSQNRNWQEQHSITIWPYIKRKNQIYIYIYSIYIYIYIYIYNIYLHIRLSIEESCQIVSETCRETARTMSYPRIPSKTTCAKLRSFLQSWAGWRHVLERLELRRSLEVHCQGSSTVSARYEGKHCLQLSQGKRSICQMPQVGLGTLLPLVYDNVRLDARSGAGGALLPTGGAPLVSAATLSCREHLASRHCKSERVASSEAQVGYLLQSKLNEKQTES